jgi:hypothetical protein
MEQTLMGRVRTEATGDNLIGNLAHGGEYVLELYLSRFESIRS